MPRGQDRRAAFAGIAIVLAIAIPVAFAAIGYDEKLTEFDFLLLGLTVTPEPPSQVVPRHTATGVRIKVAFSNGDGAFDTKSLLSLLPPGLEVVGELVGPGIDSPIKLRGPPGEFLAIPPIERNGTFLVRDIHLENDGVTFLRASPDSVTVEVIDRLLVTQVTTRPLTLEEIRQMGILFGDDSFTGFNFTLALTLDSHPVTIDFPVIFDSNGIPVPIRPTQSVDLEGGSLPLVNAGIVPVMMKPSFPPDLEIELLPLLADASIPALLVIPGDVGFLNQFFSALLVISNGAPLASGLSVQGIEASISLPAGDDGVTGSSDDPLVPAQTQGGEFTFETEGGSNRLDPGEQGTAEFLLEGRREGFHEVRFDIEGTLEGLPIGPVPMSGVARGGVLVRNPELHLTFLAPATVRAGEEFSLFVTVTNVSTTPANLVTVRLDPTRISGATLLSGPPAPIPTLGPSDSEVLEFRFLSQTTGQLRASYLNVEQGTGDLFFQLGVGERGVPLSPDTIVLPKSAESLPAAVVEAALRALGAGWSVATAPSGTLSAGVIRVSKQAVLDRATELAEAGFRVQLGEPVSLALENLAFTWAHSEDRGFEQLLRETDAGRAFFEAIGHALGPASGIGDFQRSLSTALSGLSSHILIAVGRGSGEAPIQWTLADVQGHTLVPNGVGTLPNAVFLPLSDNASPGRGIGVATRLGSTLYEWDFSSMAAASSSFDLTVSLPRANGRIGLHEFAGVETSPGEKGRLTIDLLVSNPTLTLRIDRDGDGAFEETVNETSQELIVTPPPTLIAATTIGPETLSGADPWGRVVALLFDRPMRETEVLDVENYAVDDNAVASASLQLSGRLSFLFMEAPVGGLVERQVAVSGLFGATGDALVHSTRTIDSRLTDAGAIVSGRVLSADGTPVPGAEVLYINSIPGDVMGISSKTVDKLGRYQFDWVRKSPDGPFSMRASDPESGSVRSLTTHVVFDGESIVVDLVLLGRGGVTGVVRDANGIPVPNAQVLVISGLDPTSSAVVQTNGDGRYITNGIVVGPITVKAVYETSSGLAFGNIARAGTFATVDVNIDLTVGTVAGRVFESYEGVETPVSDIDVFYLVLDGTGANELVAAVTKTDASGAYGFVDVPVPIGIFRILAIDFVRSQEASITGTFAPGQTLLVDQDVFFFIDDFGAIEVTVHDSMGSPVGAAAAFVTAAGRQLSTDALGKARFDELSPGTYGVSAREPSSSNSVSTSATVAESATTRVDLQLPGTGRLIVTVLDEMGVPVQNHAAIRTIGDPCAGEQVFTGPDGVAVFEDVPLGTATVKAVKGGDVATGTSSIQHAGDERALVLRFSGFGTATGVVVDANGPFLGADVVLASKRLDPAVCGFVDEASAQQVRTGIDGAFSFQNIPLGAFTVSASAPTFFPVPVSVSDVFLTPGETRTIELELSSNITGELSGTVFLPDGTTPSGPGVRVTASGGARPDVTVATDNAGRYAFAPIFPQGRYTLTASDSATGKVAREMIFLLRGQESVKDLRLLGRSPVEVTVVKGDGAPADDAFVELKGATFPFDRATGIITPFDDGKLVLPRISEGSFTVTANDSLGRGGRGTGVVAEDAILTRVTVSLSVTGRVTGTFLSSNGVDPVPNAEVLLRQGSTGRLLGSTTTSSQPGEMGAFAFEFVPAGSLLATATDPLTGRIGEASGTIETEGEGIDLTIVALGLGKLSGRVTSGGVGIAAAEVEVTSSTGLSSAVANLRATSTSGANGEFLFEGIPVGSFILQATLPGVAPLVGAVSGNISEDGEEITDIEIALEPSGTIEGQVLRANGIDLVAGAALTLKPRKGLFQGQSNASALFQFDFVPAGDFTLRAQETGGPDAGIVAGALGAGESLPVDVIMNGTGTVSGTALDSDGSNLTVGRVRLTRSAPFARDELTTVASDGTFAFRGVPVGDYNLSLSVDGSPLSGTAMGNIASDGASDTIAIQLASATSVEGVVVKPDGLGGNVAAANVVVTISGGDVFQSVLTSATGAFSIAGVPEGTFTIKAQDPVTGGLARTTATVSLPDPPPFAPVDAGTLVLDLEPIGVAAIVPAPGASEVAPDSSIVVTFTDPVKAASVPGRFVVSSGGANIAGTSSVSGDGLTLMFDPNPFLPPSASIEVLVDESIEDTFNRRLGTDFTSSFVTGGTVITGRVTNLGAPVDGASVTLTASSGATSALAGPDGRFRIENVASGTVTLVATSAGLTGSRVVDVGSTDGVIDTGDIPIQLVAPISGQVLAFDGSIPTDTLEVRVTQDTRIVGFASTLGDGSYTVDSVPLGGFTLDVTNPVDGDRGRRTGTLGMAGLTGFDITMNGVGDLLVVVEDATAQRLEGVQVTLSYALFGESRVENAATDANGEAVFANVAFGNVNLTAVDPLSSISTSATAIAAPGATVVLVLEPPGAIAGIVTAPGGTAVAGGSVLVFRESGNVSKAGAMTAADGSYFVPDLAPSDSPYRVDVVSNGKLRGRRRGVVVPSGGTAAVDIELVGAGTVTGRVIAPAGETLSSSVVVTLTSQAPDIGGIQSTTTSAAVDGAYTLTIVPVGDFRISARDGSQGFLREEQGAVTTDGETVTVDLELVDNGFTFPSSGVELHDGNNANYRIAQTGAIVGALDQLFDASDPDGLLLEVTVDGVTTRFAGDPFGAREEANRELVTAVEAIGALNVKRKVYVPPDGYFARYLEVLENTGPDPIDVSADLVSNIRVSVGSPAVVDSFDGDTLVDVGELWLVVDDTRDDDPFLDGVFSIPATAFVLGASGALTPSFVGLDSVGSHARLTVRYELSLSAGDRVFLLHFVSQELSRTASRAAAERLAALPPEGLVGLEGEEVSGIVNFVLPEGGVSSVEPLPRLDGRVSGSLFAEDGVTKVGSATGTGTYSIDFQSDHVLYRRRRRQNVDDGRFRFAGDPQANFVVPRVGFTVETSLTRFGETLSLSLPGDFTGATLLQDAPAVTSIPSSESSSSTLDKAFDRNVATYWATTAEDAADTIELFTEVPVRVTEVEVVPRSLAELSGVRVDLFDAQGTLSESQTASFPNGNDTVVLPFATFDAIARVVVDFDGATVQVAELSVRGEATDEVGHSLQDFIFSGTSSVDVRVTRFDGFPEKSNVNFIANSGTAQWVTDGEGRLFYAPVTSNATPMTVAVRPTANERRFLATSAVVNLVPDEIAVVDLALPEATTVSGSLFDGDGNPVTGQSVSLIGVTGPGAGLSRSNTTNPSGQFSFVDVPSGDYTLRVIRNQSTINEAITVNASVPLTHDIHLPVFGEVGVVVLFESAGATNPPASSAFVQITDSLGRIQSRFTNASGQTPSNFTNVPGGPFALSVRHPTNSGSVTLDTNHAIATTGQLLVVTEIIPAFGTVNGTVRFGDGTTAAAFADVDVSGVDVTPQTDVADSTGFYQLTNVYAVRPLTLTAHHPAIGREHITAEVQGQLSDDGQSLALPIALPKTATVEVTVTDEDTGDGISGVTILIRDSFSSTFRPEGTTNASGFRSIAVVPEPGFVVRAESGGQFVGEESATVTAHDEIVAISMIRPSDATVEGRVLAADGESVVGNAPVELRSDDGATLLDSTVTNEAGLYRFIGAVSPGTTVRVRAEFPAVPSISREETVTAAQAGETLTRDLTLDASVIKGFVFEADGTTPVENVRVDLRAEGALAFVSATTEADGSFVFLNGREGSYELRAEDGFGLVGYQAGELQPLSLLLEADIFLPEYGTVEGFVTDAVGGPLSTSPVVLVNANVLPPLSSAPDVSGFYRFERVALGSFSVTYDEPSGSSAVPGGTIGRIGLAGETVQADVALPHMGTVEGQLRDASGVVLAPHENTFVTLEGRKHETSSGVYTKPASVDPIAVTFSENGVPVGEVTVVAENSLEGTGLASSTVVEGTPVAVDVRMGTAVLLPYAPEPIVSIERDGSVRGEPDPVSGGVPSFVSVRTNAKSYPELAASPAPSGRETVLGPIRLGGIEHTRRIQVPPAAPYVRVLDVLDNPSAIDVEVSLSFESVLALAGDIATSSGDALLDAADRYLAGSTGDGGGIALVYGGTSPTLPDRTGTDGSVVHEEWRRLTIPSGGRVILLHFALEAIDEATAVGRAGALMNLLPGAAELSDLTPAEREAIVNFEVRQP